jgi:hypothetical protein
MTQAQKAIANDAADQVMFAIKLAVMHSLDEYPPAVRGKISAVIDNAYARTVRQWAPMQKMTIKKKGQS